MKKILFLLILLGCVFVSHAQQSVFKEFEGKSGVTTITFSKSLLSMMGTLPGENDDINFSAIKNKLDEFQMLVAENDAALQVRNVCKKVKKESKFESLMRIVEEDAVIDFLLGKDGKKNKLLMLIDSEKEIIVFGLTGDFTLQDIQEITSR